MARRTRAFWACGVERRGGNTNGGMVLLNAPLGCLKVVTLYNSQENTCFQPSPSYPSQVPIFRLMKFFFLSLGWSYEYRQRK